MRILLCAYNAKYSHTNLAVRSLKSAMPKEFFTEILEATINDPYDRLIQELFEFNADIYAFSCYIWNAPLVGKLTADLKRIKPNAIIVLGGPEVSFDIPSVFKSFSAADYVVCGEGEESLPELFNSLTGSRELPAGVACRERPMAQYRMVKEFDALPFPYSGEDLKALCGRIMYYEASRGCPFSCAYCLSSVTKGVRSLPIDRVISEIAFMVKAGVTLIKFVDRTFNCDKNRTLTLFRQLSRIEGDFTLHFEVCADLLDKELIDFLSTVPVGRFQFEAGVQSTNAQTLAAVNRPMNTMAVLSNLSALKTNGNIHLHADLIAGLPFEDYKSFANSFNEVYLVCNKLQLGFLKLLPGSPLREKAADYDYEWRDTPPYEVLQNRFLSFLELSKLKWVEEALEIYSNSGRFEKSLTFAINRSLSPFDFFEGLSQYIEAHEGFWPPSAPKRQFELLLDFYRFQQLPDVKLFIENLRLDYLCHFRGEAPDFLCSVKEKGLENAVKAFLKNEGKCKKVLQYLPNGELAQLYKFCKAQVFYLPERKVLLIDYKHQKLTDITGLIKN